MFTFREPSPVLSEEDAPPSVPLSDIQIAALIDFLVEMPIEGVPTFRWRPWRCTGRSRFGIRTETPEMERVPTLSALLWASEADDRRGYLEWHDDHWTVWCRETRGALGFVHAGRRMGKSMSYGLDGARFEPVADRLPERLSAEQLVALDDLLSHFRIEGVPHFGRQPYRLRNRLTVGRGSLGVEYWRCDTLTAMLNLADGETGRIEWHGDRWVAFARGEVNQLVLAYEGRSVGPCGP